MLTARKSIEAALAVLVVAAAACSTGSPPQGAPPTPSPAVQPTAAATAPAVPPTAAATDAAMGLTERPEVEPSFTEYPVAAGEHPHDVAPAPDGRIWYTAQHIGALGVLDPETGQVRTIPLGSGSAPHGVIVGPDGAPWITDGGLNAIVRVDPDTEVVDTFPLPTADNVNLNTASFDGQGTLWFTGNAGVYGSVDPQSGDVEVFDAPRGAGPYGIATTPDGTVWYASLEASYIARIDSTDGSVDVVDVPTPGGGARRVWSDSQGRLWVAEWFAGNVGRYDSSDGTWQEWRLPGDQPQPYAVYVDDTDTVWLTDHGNDTLVEFNPRSETFRSFSHPTPQAAVRQLLGRPGEVWGAGSAVDSLLVLDTG